VRWRTMSGSSSSSPRPTADRASSSRPPRHLGEMTSGRFYAAPSQQHDAQLLMSKYATPSERTDGGQQAVDLSCPCMCTKPELAGSLT
jgi:hypothetical protein